MRTFHKLSAEQIVPGQALPWDIFDDAGTLLLRRGNIVGDAAQAEVLAERGMYVDEAEYVAYQQGRAEPPYDPFHIVASATANLHYLLTHLPRDDSLQADIEREAERLSWVAEHSADTALAMMQLANPSPYPASHAVFTAILADLVAQSLGWDDDRRISTLCAALTMNAGMHTLQAQLFRQRESLSPAQQAVVREHPALGARRLIECGINDDEWLRAVLEHHEQADGSGYPRQVDDAGEIARLIQTCDIFAAMLSPRSYRPQLSGHEAIIQIRASANGPYPNPFGSELARLVGPYPPGTLVRLQSGEIGVSFRRGANPATPEVVCLIDAKGMRNSRAPLRRTDDPAHTIDLALAPGKAMISVPLEKLWRHAG